MGSVILTVNVLSAKCIFVVTFRTSPTGVGFVCTAVSQAVASAVSVALQYTLPRMYCCIDYRRKYNLYFKLEICTILMILNRNHNDSIGTQKFI